MMCKGSHMAEIGVFCSSASSLMLNPLTLFLSATLALYSSKVW